MVSFGELCAEAIVEEGLFSIPKERFQGIFDYVLAAHKKFKYLPSRQKTGRFQVVKPKVFPLDLRGTSFEKLAELKPKVKVFIFNKKTGYGGYFSPWDEELGKPAKGYGCIYLNAAAPPSSTLVQDIEHELLHYVQELFRGYKEKLSPGSSPSMGGLPPARLLPQTSVSADERKRRSVHHRRPEEIYPNLTSAVRDLQYDYFQVLEIKKREDTPDNRKAYFRKRLDNLDQEKGTKRKFPDLFSKVKRDDPELFKFYVKQAYKAFVDDEDPGDMASREKALQDYEAS